MTPDEMSAAIQQMTSLVEQMGAAIKSIDARMTAIEGRVKATSPDKPIDVALVPGTPAEADAEAKCGKKTKADAEADAEADADAEAEADGDHEDEAEDRELIREELGKLTSAYKAAAKAINANAKMFASEFSKIRAAMGKLATDKNEVEPEHPTVQLNTGRKTPANTEEIRNSQDNKVVYGDGRTSLSAAGQAYLAKYGKGTQNADGSISEEKLTEAMRKANLTPEQRMAVKIELGEYLA